MEPPKRYIEFGLRVEADSLRDVATVLTIMAEEIGCGEKPCDVVAANRYEYSVRTAIRANEGVTHESYFEELDRWIEAENESQGEA